MGTSHHQCHREDTGSGNWGEVENKVDDNKKRCWGLGGCCLLNSGMKKTDQEIIVSRKHKSGLEIEVLRLYQSGVEMQGMGYYGCMTTKNAVGVWGGAVCYLVMTTKNAHGDA